MRCNSWITSLTRCERRRTAAHGGVFGTMSGGAMATATISVSNPVPGDATNTAISCGSAIGEASRSSRTWSTITTILRRSAPSGNTTRPLPKRISITGMRGALPITRSPEGGYLDNGSTGYTPRFWEEIVRQQFISSAAFLIEEMHVDGLRVDLTQAIHRDNALHADRTFDRQPPTSSGRNCCGSGAVRCT